MSLVDYASSSEDEDADVRDKEEEIDEKSDPLLANLDSHNQRSIISSSQTQTQRESHNAASESTITASAIERLPDASLLLNSVSTTFSSASHSHQMMGDHTSRVAAAMASSRKRESNGSASSYPRSKFPRGNLPHSRNSPDTLLIPPQLRGRSNVVTEDIGKLFVRRQADPSSRS